MSKYYYTIGEVGNLLGVKPYVIRYWETEFSQLRPKKGHGRIRKFNEEQITLLRKIKDMLYIQRFTIEGARKKLKEDRSLQQQTELELTYGTAFKQQTKHKIKLNAVEELKNLRQMLVSMIEKAKSFHASNE